MSQQGEHDISRGARHEREAEISRLPRLAHKAPVVQAKSTEYCLPMTSTYAFLFNVLETDSETRHF